MQLRAAGCNGSDERCETGSALPPRCVLLPYIALALPNRDSCPFRVHSTSPGLQPRPTISLRSPLPAFLLSDSKVQRLGFRCWQLLPQTYCKLDPPFARACPPFPASRILQHQCNFPSRTSSIILSRQRAQSIPSFADQTEPPHSSGLPPEVVRDGAAPTFSASEEVEVWDDVRRISVGTPAYFSCSPRPQWQSQFTACGGASQPIPPAAPHVAQYRAAGSDTRTNRRVRAHTRKQGAGSDDAPARGGAPKSPC